MNDIDVYEAPITLLIPAAHSTSPNIIIPA
jgi:hypothetical protein